MFSRLINVQERKINSTNGVIKTSTSVYTDSDTNVTWYMLISPDDPRGGIGNALIITEYVHMTNIRYHNNIGFTLFQNAEARTKLENWFNNPSNVGEKLRNRALDYEFQDNKGNPINRNSTEIGAGIEINRLEKSTNNTGSVPVDIKVDRGYTRPLAHGVGTPMAFILSMSEVNEYFCNNTQCSALAADTSAVGWWWLRSPSSNTKITSNNRHAFINTVGDINDGNASYMSVTRGLRPALWVSIDDKIKKSIGLK